MLTLVRRRRAANDAARAVAGDERSWREATSMLRAWCRRHRAGVIVGGGFVAGMIGARAPWSTLARGGALFGGAASWIARAAMATGHDDAGAPRDATSGGHA